MTHLLPSRSELETAAQIVYSAMPPTPQYTWPLLNEALGTEAWIKHENHTPTGAFKVRGGLVYMHELTRRQPQVGGVIAATRGNHGQSVGFAVRRHGLQATIVVPHGNSKEKNAAMRLYYVATHNLAEGAGAAPLAAALQMKDRLKGRKIGLPLGGANVDHDQFARILSAPPPSLS